MLSLLQAMFLGILQGVAEWLPISSTGHLAIAQHYMAIQAPVAFDVMLHIATLVVVIWYMRKEIAAILKALCKRDFKSPPGRMLTFVIIGSIPTAAIGLAFRSLFEAMFASMAAIGAALLVTAAILVASSLGKGTRQLDGKRAFLTGIAQGVAVAPGVSRSGATIGIAMASGAAREEAIRLSFLLAIPAIAGAMLLEAGSLAASGIAAEAMAAGFIASLAAGWLSLKALVKLVAKGRMAWFAVYCIGLGMLLLLF